jgi:hypothetical protein
MKTLMLTFLSLVAFNSQASVLCHTPRMNKVFEVKGNKIIFLNESAPSNKRELASVSGRTISSVAGFTKVVNFENQKHTIHINDMNNFSDFNDYIIIKARTGHEVTYPLTCEQN